MVQGVAGKGDDLDLPDSADLLSRCISSNPFLTMGSPWVTAIRNISVGGSPLILEISFTSFITLSETRTETCIESFSISY